MSNELKDHCKITTLDLHREQARQAAILENMCSDIKEIKDILVGSDNRQGLIMDVDRLKRSRAILHAVVWVVFTTAIATAATAISAYTVNQ